MMEGYITDDFLTLPLVLDSSEYQTVSLVNYNTWQLEVSKDQSTPLVILENGDLALQTDCPVPTGSVSSENLKMKDEISNLSGSPIDNQDESLPVEDDKKQPLEKQKSCSEIADTIQLTDNLNDLIEKVVLYKCKLCSFKSPEISALSFHLKTFHLKNVELNTSNSIVKETSKEDVSEKTAFMCAKCTEAFGTFSDWRQHLASVHKTAMNVKSVLENPTLNGGRPIIDLNGEKNKFVSSSSAPVQPSEDKEIDVVPEKDKKFGCIIRSCLVRLSSRDLVEKHRECHAGPRHFACPQCSQPFRKWCDCANHLWTCHSQDIDLYSCPNCEYKTAVKTKFKHHLKIHSDEKEYMCKECGKTFKQAVQLTNHRVFHLKAIGSPNIPNWSKKPECSQCKRTFYDQKSLKKHIQSVHSNLRPYVCHVCGHKSANKNKMGLHLRQHTGEKPFSCPLCEFTTGDQNCLRRHAWRHSHVRPYSCPHCAYSCIQSHSLKKHITALHPGAPGILSCSKCSYTTLSESTLGSHIAKAHCNEDEVKDDKNADLHLGHGKSQDPAEVMDEESQNCFEVPIVDTGGITIPAD